MSGKLKALAGVGVAASVVAAIFLITHMNRDNFEKLMAEDEPIGILVALTGESPRGEDQTEVLGQLIIFPKQKRAFFFFVNTDAYYEGEDEPISALGLRSADRFEGMTQVSSSFRITIDRASAIRFIDLIRGFTFFLEEPAVFDKQDFSYPQGVHFFSGEQYLEYSLARHTTQPDRAFLNGVERLRRFESMLLNLLWRREQIQKELADDSLQDLALELLDTNLGHSEFLSLIDFLGNEDTCFSVQELPLQIVEKRRRQILVVKPKSSRVLFQTYREDVESGHLKNDNFPIEVLNGTEVAGLARRVKQYMQDRGLQVLDADNFGYKPVRHSIIVERSGDTWKARHLQKLTSLKTERVVFRRQPMDVEASFIIGDDFQIKQLKSQ